MHFRIESRKLMWSDSHRGVSTFLHLSLAAGSLDCSAKIWSFLNHLDIYLTNTNIQVQHCPFIHSGTRTDSKRLTTSWFPPPVSEESGSQTGSTQFTDPPAASHSSLCCRPRPEILLLRSCMCFFIWKRSDRHFRSVARPPENSAVVCRVGGRWMRHWRVWLVVLAKMISLGSPHSACIHTLYLPLRSFTSDGRHDEEETRTRYFKGNS